MGSFFSTGNSPSRGPAGEAHVGDDGTLKESQTKVLKSPTPTKSKRDGRSYAEVVRAGVETNSMSKLSMSSAAWKFCEAPKDEKMFERECLP